MRNQNTQPKVLWIDDDFYSKDVPRKSSMESLRFTLNDLVKNKLGVSLDFTKTVSDETASNLIIDEQFDLIILDLEFMDPNGERLSSNGFKVLERCQKIGIHPPIIILSSHVNDGLHQYEEELLQYSGVYIEAFPKDRSMFERVATCISNTLQHPPVTLVVMSDMHLRYALDGSYRSDPEEIERNYKDTLINEFSELKHSVRPDFLVAAGDFAWKDQEKDLPEAARFINKLRQAIGLVGENEFHFCPGNHDVSLTKKDGKEWSDFHCFVDSLSAIEPTISARFSSTRRGGKFGNFHVKDDIMAVATHYDNSILFAGLNSVSLKRSVKSKKIETFGEVGSTQLNELRSKLNEYKDQSSQLRIAICHHPIFSSPSDQKYEEDRPIKDQSEVCFSLAEMGFDLLIHGHTHYSCFYEFGFTPLNEVNISGNNSRKRNLRVIGVPTLAAAPNMSSPSRQYLVIRIGHQSSYDIQRSLIIQSRVYDPASNT